MNNYDATKRYRKKIYADPGMHASFLEKARLYRRRRYREDPGVLERSNERRRNWRFKKLFYNSGIPRTFNFRCAPCGVVYKEVSLLKRSPRLKLRTSKTCTFCGAVLYPVK